MNAPGDDRIKLYYSIGEVSDLLGVNASLLRFWEKSFGLSVKKNGKGIRQYTRRQIEELKQIQQLVKVKGMTLAGAKSQLAKPNPTEIRDELLASLKALRAELAALKSNHDQ